LIIDLFVEPQRVIEEIERRNIGVLSVTTTPSAWTGTSRLAEGCPPIRTALGLHPQLAHERIHELGLFEKFLPETRFVGEIGLDGSPALRSGWLYQVEVFDTILKLCADAGGKIASIHSRRAAGAVLDAIGEHPGMGRAILHWFSGSKTELRRAVDLGCWFSLGPAMLRTSKGRSLVSAMPRTKILLETDAPFAALPNQRLHPWDIQLAAEALCSIWQLDLAHVLAQLRANESALVDH
jgi:TatD DNase family protein